ncbi:MAG: polyamine ABC transporter substrate-binding protein [Actinomycetota bacterium]
MSIDDLLCLEHLAGRRLTRRDLLRATGTGGVGIAAAALFAACGGLGADTTPTGAEGTPSGLPPLAHELSIAQWPLYIDPGKRGADSPTLVAFEQETGIDVTYRENINDNAAFFGKLLPQMSADQDPGYDLVTLSDWVVVKMERLGWLATIDHDALPTVTANIGPAFADPAYDPGNAHSIPWQGGITGIAYDPGKTGRDLTAFADLWDPVFAGHVGMLTEMVDTMNLTLLSLGVDIQNATADDVQRAQQKLLDQRDAGIVRQYYGQDYTRALAEGDVWATMAWSGDVLQLQLANPDLRFVVPEEGGILWVTPMELLRTAQHPADAHAFLDFVYRPEIAAAITEWVGYVTPVPAVQDLVRQHAAEATKAADRDYLEFLAESPLVFPTDDMLANLHSYKVLSQEEEQSWAEAFSVVLNG